MNLKLLLISLTLIFIVTGCQKQKLSVIEIVNKSISTNGGDIITSSKISFDFRDKHYSSKRLNGKFEFRREFADSNGNKIKDVLDNKLFTRYINGKETNLTDEGRNAFSGSINSVIYFALLPYGLNDKAVHKVLLGEVNIKGKYYYKIKVAFSQNGGGEDFDDVFIYWINKDNYSMDYLAYLYHVNSGGTRFREAVNIRTINGIRFSDYINYGTEGLGYNIVNYDKDFEKGKIKKISEINLKNIIVEKL